MRTRHLELESVGSLHGLFFFCEIVVTARVNLGRLIPVFSHIIARLTFVLSRLTLVMLRRKFVFVRLQNGSDTE